MNRESAQLRSAARRDTRLRRRKDPTSLAARDERIDMLRGLALISMFIAHCAPGGGLAKILNLSEYATAPLFALLIGMGAQVADRGWGRLVPTLVRAGIRAAILVGIGLWLVTLGAQIDIVLVSLALPTLFAPLLARLGTWLLVFLAGALWAAAPTLRAWASTEYISAILHRDMLARRLWEVLVTGQHYRLTTLAVFVVLGILVSRWVPNSREPARVQVGVAVAALVAAAGLMVAQQAGRIQFEAYSGTRLEVAFTVLLVGGLAILWMTLVPTNLPGGPLAAAGAMTLSIYVLQIWYLAWFVHVAKPGQSDDSWLNVVVLCVGALAFAQAWRASVRHEPWCKGPIEGPTTAVTRLFR